MMGAASVGSTNSRVGRWTRSKRLIRRLSFVMENQSALTHQGGDREMRPPSRRCLPGSPTKWQVKSRAPIARLFLVWGKSNRGLTSRATPPRAHRRATRSARSVPGTDGLALHRRRGFTRRRAGDRHTYRRPVPSAVTTVPRHGPSP